MPGLSPKYSSSPALRLEPVLSPGLCVLALILALASTASVLLSATPAWLGALLSALACVCVVAQITRLHRFCDGRQVRALVYEQGSWSVQLNTGNSCPLELVSTPLVCGLVMAARFRRQHDSADSYRLFLLPDMVERENWRRAALALGQGREDRSG